MAFFVNRSFVSQKFASMLGTSTTRNEDVRSMQCENKDSCPYVNGHLATDDAMNVLDDAVDFVTIAD